MAFHPFKHFRKRQKVYLAALTILTMIIFVAQFGAGDPFTRLQQWIGMAIPQGDPVLELYGKKIYEEDLNRVRHQRQLASQFILFNAGEFQRPLQKTLADIQKKYGEAKGKTDRSGPVSTALAQMNEAMFKSFITPQPEQKQKAYLEALSFVLRKQMSNPDVQNNAEQYYALDAIANELALECWALDPQHRPNDFYFGGRPSREEDQLDFLVWKHQADRLGIELTQADVYREVNRAWGNGDFLPVNDKFDTNKYVAAFFRTNTQYHKSLTARDLLAALTDEFRVAMAKQALLGSSSGVRAYREAVDGVHLSPSAATPDEFYKYFQEQRTELSVTMLPIAVKSFVDKVETKPSEADLRNLYERYKNDEPSPTRRQPAFKEPRRIKLAYFRYRPEGPYARQLAEKVIQSLVVEHLTGPAGIGPVGGAFSGTMALSSPLAYDYALFAQYEEYRNEESRRVWVKYDQDDTGRFGLPQDLLNPQLVDVQAAASAVGEALGGLAGGGTTLGAPLAWLGTQQMAERATLTAYASAVLGAAGSPLTAVTLPMRYRHTLQPLEAVREQLIDRFQNKLAQQLMEKNIERLRKDLDKVLTAHSETKLKEFLQKAEKEYGIENVHIMETARSRQEILDRLDPQLKELQEAYDQARENPLQEYQEFRLMRPDFAVMLFHPFGLTEMDRQRLQSGEKIDRPLFSPSFHSTLNDVGWVFMRFEDQKEHVRPFQKIHDEVKDAWYLEQARKLAREKAQRINEELKQKNLAPDPARQFLIQQNLGTPFDLNRVAHLRAPDFHQPGIGGAAGSYQEYQAPREFIPYPPADFVTQLLKLKKRGDSMVLADRPVRHFYVAVLREDPKLPDMKEFQEVYSTQAPELRLSENRESLWERMMAERQRKYARTLLEQLRAEATKQLQDGEYVLPENLRKRSDASENGE